MSDNLWFRKALIRLEHHLRRNILAGLIVLVPSVITYVVIRFVVDFVDGLLLPVTSRFFHAVVPGLGLALTIVGLYFIGLMVTTVVGRQLVNLGNTLVERIPFVRVIYRTARQFTDVFSNISTARYQRVVFLEFPCPGVRSVGLVTGEWHGPNGRLQLMVYIPTVPNPTSGFLVVVPAEQVEPSDMSVEDAIKLVVSAGVLAEEVSRKANANSVRRQAVRTPPPPGTPL
ncbi:MAG: DUF502 domain-containing protein [Dehalococcoidia bacterium]